MASSSMRALPSAVSFNRLKNLGPPGSSVRSVGLMFPSPSLNDLHCRHAAGRVSPLGPIGPAQGPLDPTAAQHARAIARVRVEDAGLTGGDAVFAVLQQHSGSVGRRKKCRRLQRRRGAYADGNGHSPRGYRRICKPVHVPKGDLVRMQALARSDHNLPLCGIEAHDEEGLRARDAKPAALADRVVDDAGVSAEHAPVDMHDLARLRGAGLEALDYARVAPARHEADVLTIGLVGHRQAEAARQVAYFGLAVAAEGEAQPLKLRARGCEQEVALVALRVAGTVELGADGPLSQFDVVAGGEGIGLQLACGREQFVELDLLVARHARDWRPPRRIAVNERLHDGRPKALLVIEHVVGDAKPVGDTAGVVDVLARTAGAAPPECLTMIVELEGDADDVATLLLEQRGDDRGVNAPGHGHHHAPRAARACKPGRPNSVRDRSIRHHYGGRGHGRVAADSRLTKIPALCPSLSAAAIWRRVKAQSRPKVPQGASGPDPFAFGNGCAGSVQLRSPEPAQGLALVKGRSALTKKPVKLTNVSANNGAAVVAVFTASLRSLLIAFV